MQEYTITKIARYTTDKEGNTLKTKDGRPYTRVNLKVAEHGDKWVSGFGSNTNVNWKEGDKVELTITQKGEYLNFSEPKKEDKVNEKLEQILNNLTTIKLMLNNLGDKISPSKKVEPPYDYPTPEEEGINLDEQPF